MKPSSRSPEVEAFRREYKDLLRHVYRPVELAQSLFSEGVISSETKNATTSDEDVEGKRILLHAAEHALVHASDREAMFQNLMEALKKIRYNTYWIKKFVNGEHINTLW